MYICETNYTVAIYALYFNNYLYAENNQVKGVVGQHYQKLINTRKSFPFLCKLTNVSKIGDKLANHSYDGALGLIEQKKVDFLLRSQPVFIESDLVAFTPATNSENYLISHPLHHQAKISDRKMFFKFFDFNYLLALLVAYVAFFLLGLIMVFMLSRTSTLNVERKKLLKSISFIFTLMLTGSVKKRSFIALILIGYVFFNFLSKQIFLINIKTDKILVDTTNVLTNEQRLFESKLKAIWLQGERDLYLAQTSPKGTFLYNLNRYKNFEPPAVFSKVGFISQIKLARKGFIFMNSRATMVVVNFLTKFFKVDAFVNERPFYSTYNVLYKIKEQSERIQLIDKGVYQLIEGGLFEKFIFDVKATKLLAGHEKNRIYYSLDEYIGDQTKFEKLNLDNLFYLFVAYYAFTLSPFLIFLYHHLIIRITRSAKLRKLVKIILIRIFRFCSNMYSKIYGHF